jgi:hypothetical protein
MSRLYAFSAQYKHKVEKKLLAFNIAMHRKYKGIPTIGYVDEGTLSLPYDVGIKFEQALGVLEYIQGKTRKLRGVMKKEFTLREEQIPIFKQIMDYLEQTNVVCIEAHTGFGKTALCIAASMNFPGPIVTFVDGQSARNAWRFSFERITHLHVVDLGEVSAVPPNADVYIVTHGTMSKLPASISLSVGTLIVDEFDTFKTDKRLALFRYVLPSKIIICSATYNTIARVLSKCFTGNSRVIKKYDGPLCINKVATPFIPECTKRGKYLDWKNYVRSLIDNERRNELICGIIEQCSERKVIVGTESESHARHLHKLIPNSSLFIGSAKSFTEARVLIGTYQKLGRGMDEESYCTGTFSGVRSTVLINATPISGNEDVARLNQFLGRILRQQDPSAIGDARWPLCPTVYHLIDRGNLAEGQWWRCYNRYKTVAPKMKIIMHGETVPPEINDLLDRMRS